MTFSNRPFKNKSQLKNKKGRSMKKLIISAVLLLFTAVSFAQGTIKINVAGLKNNQGQLIVLLFKKGDDFGVSESPFRKIKCTTLSENKASFDIKGVKNGEYAFIVFHDVDGNEACLTNWAGMPKEGIGKSIESGGQPSYENSKFFFNGTQATFNINIKYL